MVFGAMQNFLPYLLQPHAKLSKHDVLMPAAAAATAALVFKTRK
jgi:hypothetical protein